MKTVERVTGVRPIGFNAPGMHVGLRTHSKSSRSGFELFITPTT